jgi:hypothetical protein
MKISKLLFRLRLAMLPKQSHPMAKSAVKGLLHRDWPRGPHLCEKWTRYTRQDAYGYKFAHLQKPTARETGIAFRDAGYAVPLEAGSVEGDQLYKLSGSGGDGHVATRIRGNMVAENASVHWDGHDSRGLRTLREYGSFDLIVRLPKTNQR